MKDFRTYDFLHALNLYSAEPSRFIAFLRELLPEEIEEEEIRKFIIK